MAASSIWAPLGFTLVWTGRIRTAETAGRGSLARARELGFRTNMEMASLEGDILRPIVRPCLPLLDSIVINDLEGEAVTEIEIRPDGVLDWEAAGRACRRLCEMGVRQVAAIHFPEGAVAVDAEGTLHAQASVRWPDSRIVSAVGAGDAFAAGSSMACTKGGRYRADSSSRSPWRRSA